MNKSFADALQAGLIEAAVLWDGSPFIVDGVQYYRAKQEGINMTFGRFHAMTEVLRRHDSLKIGSESVVSYMETMDMLTNRILAQINLDLSQVQEAALEMKILSDRMKTRLDIGMSVEQVYEIASIWFFSDQESPSEIDRSTNQRKIQAWANWNQADLLYAYFLSQPIGGFVPLKGLSRVDTLDYIQKANHLELLDLTRLLIKFNRTLDPAVKQAIDMRRETLFSIDNSLSLLLTTSAAANN